MNRNDGKSWIGQVTYFTKNFCCGVSAGMQMQYFVIGKVFLKSDVFGILCTAIGYISIPHGVDEKSFCRWQNG